MAMKKKVIKHLKGDIKSFKKETEEDKKLIKSLKHKDKHEKGESKKHEKGESKREERAEHKKKKDPKPYPKGKVAERKEKKVFDEAKAGKLHSGSKKGPLVTNRKQVIAIALSEGRKAAAGKKKK